MLGHQDRLGADLECPQGGGGVRGEERVARAGGEDDDPLLLEVANRPASNVRLGDLGRGERREIRVCAPRRSSASWSAMALRRVASMPA
jgi:hypothetical protein